MITLMRKILKVIGLHYKKLILPIILTCIDSILYMMMFGLMIDIIIKLSQNIFSKKTLSIYFAICLTIFIIRAIISSINYTQVQYRGADITSYLRLFMGNHIRNLNLGYFEKNSIGNLTSILSTDINDFEHVVTHSLTTFFKIIFFTVVALAYGFYINYLYGFVILVILIVTLPFIGLGGKVANKYSGKSRAAINEVISKVVEYINGIKTFKLYNLTGDKFKKLDKSFVNLKKQSIITELSIAPFVIIFSFFTSLIIPLSLILGTIFLSKNMITTEKFVGIIMIGISISTMMTSLGTLYPEMNYIGRAADNILALYDEKQFSYNIDNINFDNCEIVFENVTFGYGDNGHILHDISLIAKPNTVTALVGPSGSGKTTIISLIGRFWDVEIGCIKIDNTVIKNISPDALTKNIAMVFQDVYLFSDTIANNIRIGKPDATMEEIIESAQYAQCHDFIRSLPNGYDTIIGEGGSTLSGGEKQRISIARALIKDAPIVLLDETTSSLDADNEMEINKALDILMKNKTVIVIAHRLNTIVNADNIIVLENGHILEEGTHRKLANSDGWYSHMISEHKKSMNWKVK